MYESRGQIENSRPENRHPMLLGTLLIFGGLFGFRVEARLRRV